MSTLSHLRNFWILWVTTIVLACFSNAVAQASYKVQDLGVQNPDNLGMAMGLNNYGGTLIMDQLLDHFPLSVLYPAVKGTVRISKGDLNLELGTLGGENSSINWNGINDPGQAVGMSETSVSDPNGEDVCGFGTHLTCSPFLWQNGTMIALPTVGGNNGQASAINNSGQVAGYAENGIADSTCPAGTENFMIDLPVVWTNGNAKALPTITGDPDGVAYGINNRGQAVGYSGTCIQATHPVVWENNNTVTKLQDLGDPGGIAYAINSHNQVVGQAVNSDGTALAAIWQNHTVAALGGLLPGDVASFATSINNQGQVVGSSFDSRSNWSRGLLWQNGVMIDLNTVFPASSNLFVVSASNINESGQIAGMAVDMAGLNAGRTIVHAFLATPVDEDQGKSVADVVPTHPEITLPAANVGKQLLPRSAHCSIHDKGIF
jgi:probable HAF family extracellular repeat protein